MHRIVIAATLCLLAASSAARADIKSVPASVCRPGDQVHAGRLLYTLRGVRNRDRNRKARVICPLLRDNFDGTKFETALTQVVVGARVAAGTTLVCKFLVRRFDTVTQQWSRESVRASVPGPFARFFEFDPPTPYRVQLATMAVQCILPPRAEIDSFFWVEQSPTDEPPTPMTF